jgi:hypothetical protein
VMTEDRDLLPWILGTLSMAAVAMAVAVGLTGRTTSAHASSQTTSSPPALATAELNSNMQNSATPAGSAPASAAPAAAAPAATASSSAAQAYPEPASARGVGAAQAPAPTPNASGNQIWECTTNGVKTFSNNRCGNAAVLHEVGPINIMDPSPASNVHWYGAGPGAGPNDAPDYYDPGPQQPADNSYPAVVGIPYLERRRPERAQQAPHHDRGHPRRN